MNPGNGTERDAPAGRDPRDLSVAALAYLGDSVVELCARAYLVRERGLSTSAGLNEAALAFVRASAQSDAVSRIEPCLTEVEAGYFRRGRNDGHAAIPKRVEAARYRRATGMETLFAYLFLTGRSERIDELFRIGYQLPPAAGGPGGGT